LSINYKLTNLNFVTLNARYTEGKKYWSLLGYPKHERGMYWCIIEQVAGEGYLKTFLLYPVERKCQTQWIWRGDWNIHQRTENYRK